ncbi:MAG: hypothetical protein AABZ64_17420 [Nitrospinota bacterium]
MPNRVSIEGDFRDNITPGLERVSRAAQQAQGPVQELGKELSRTDQATKQIPVSQEV